MEIKYRIILPYQEVGHENRPWIMLRIEALDGQDLIGYLKLAWLDYEWIRNNYQKTLEVKPGLSQRRLWRWIAERAGWVYVDFSRVSFIYRRKGIATTMYKLGAAWLAIHRKTGLHSSSLQKDCAISLWNHLKSLGLPIYQKPTEKHIYDCLDYSQSPALRLQARRLLTGTTQQNGPIGTQFKVTNPEELRFKEMLALKDAVRLPNAQSCQNPQSCQDQLSS